MFNLNRILLHLEGVSGQTAKCLVHLVEDVHDMVPRLNAAETKILKEALIFQASQATSSRGAMNCLGSRIREIIAAPTDTWWDQTIKPSRATAANEMICVLVGTTPEGDVIRGYSRGKNALVCDLEHHQAFLTQQFAFSGSKTSDILIKGQLETELRFIGHQPAVPKIDFYCHLEVAHTIPEPLINVLLAILSLDLDHRRLPKESDDFSGTTRLLPLLRALYEVACREDQISEVDEFCLPLKPINVKKLCDVCGFSSPHSFQITRKWVAECKDGDAMDASVCVPRIFGRGTFKIEPPTMRWLCAQIHQEFPIRASDPLYGFTAGHLYDEIDSGVLDEHVNKMSELVRYCYEHEADWQQLIVMAVAIKSFQEKRVTSHGKPV